MIRVNLHTFNSARVSPDENTVAANCWVFVRGDILLSACFTSRARVITLSTSGWCQSGNGFNMADWNKCTPVTMVACRHDGYNSYWPADQLYDSCAAFLRSDILMPVHIKIAIFSDVTQYCLVNMYQNFGAVGCLHLQMTFQANVTLRSPTLDIKADNLTSHLKNRIICLHYQPSLPS